MATETQPTPPPTVTPTAAFTDTAQPITDAHTPTAHNTHTQSPTHTAAIPTLGDHQPIEIEPVSVQFAAIRQNCPLPQGSTLDTVPPNCLHSGLIQGEFLNFGSFSQLHTLRISYSFPDGSDFSSGFLETIHLAVYKFTQNGNYQTEPVLFTAPLQLCDHDPAILFCDLAVNDLQKTGYLALIAAIRKDDGHVVRADPILFYEPPPPTLTPTPTLSPLPPQPPTQAPMVTNTPLPTTTPTIAPTATCPWV